MTPTPIQTAGISDTGTIVAFHYRATPSQIRPQRLTGDVSAYAITGPYMASPRAIECTDVLMVDIINLLEYAFVTGKDCARFNVLDALGLAER